LLFGDKAFEVVFQIITGDLKLYNFHCVFIWNVSFDASFRELWKSLSLDFYVCCVVGEEDFLNHQKFASIQIS
jgi:hypothetical protein